MCENCKIPNCPILNKSECPINKLCKQLDDATAELLAEADKLTSGK